MNAPSWLPETPETPEIQDAIWTALDNIIAEHFQVRLDKLEANVADLLEACEFDVSVEDQFPYGRLEFTKAQAEFIRSSLLNKDYFVISFNGGDTTAIRSALSTRVRGEVIQGGIEWVDIESRIASYMEKHNFTVIDGRCIGVDAKPFLSQCRNIAEAWFRQLFNHTVKQHLQYLKRKAIEIKRKSALVIAWDTSDQNKRSVLEASLTRWRHPNVKVSYDGRLELSLDLFSAPIWHLSDKGISAVESDNLENNAYWEILLNEDSDVYPFIEHWNIPSFLRFYFGDTPFEAGWDINSWLVHWWNLDTEHGRLLSFFFDPKTDIVWLFDQCMRVMCIDPEMWLEYLSDDRNDSDSHPSNLPGMIRFRVLSSEEVDAMIEDEIAIASPNAPAIPPDQRWEVRVADWVSAWAGGIKTLVRRIVGAFT